MQSESQDVASSSTTTQPNVATYSRQQNTSESPSPFCRSGMEEEEDMEHKEGEEAVATKVGARVRLGASTHDVAHSRTLCNSRPEFDTRHDAHSHISLSSQDTSMTLSYWVTGRNLPTIPLRRRGQ